MGRDLPTREELEAGLQELAGGVESFLSSLPFMAPESLGLQAQVKLSEPLNVARALLKDGGCTCGNGQAEEDRGAVLRCAVHGPQGRERSG